MPLTATRIRDARIGEIQLRPLALCLLLILAAPPSGLANPKWTLEQVVNPAPAKVLNARNTVCQPPLSTWVSLADQGKVLIMNTSEGRTVTVTFPGAPPQTQHQSRCVVTVTLTLDHGGIQSVVKTFANAVL